MSILRQMAFKFFDRDVVTGVAEKKGDRFTAQFFGQMTWFVVEEVTGGCIMAFVDEKEV